MKLSSETMDILTNYAGIHQSLYIEAGSILKAVSEGSHIYSEAILEEEFPCDFRIYDLKDFLRYMSIIKNCEIDFTEQFARLYNGNTEIIYNPANSDVVEKRKSFKGFGNSPILTFKLTQNQLTGMLKFASMLETQNIVIQNEDGELRISCSENYESSNKFNILLDEDSEDFSLKVIYDASSFKIINDDYDVEIYENGYIKLFNDSIFYIIAPTEVIETE